MTSISSIIIIIHSLLLSLLLMIIIINDNTTTTNNNNNDITIYRHTRHTLPPSEIDLGLFRADFTDLEGKPLFHRIG